MNKFENILKKAKKKLNNIKLIITHPASAHRDDFLAVGLALTLVDRDIPVERREPVKKELDNPNILILDVGRRFEPKLNNFDHHQFPKGRVACALSIFAQSMGVDKIFEKYEWYEVTKVFDSQGPKKLAEFLGFPKIPPEDPIEAGITKLIKKGKLPQWPQLAKKIVQYFVSRAVELEERLPWLRKNTEIRIIKNLPVLIIPSNNILGHEEYREEISSKFKTPIGAGIWHNDRGRGWRLIRYDDDPRVDFRKLEGKLEMQFIHANGFTAATKERLPIEEVLKLVEKSIIK